MPDGRPLGDHGAILPRTRSGNIDLRKLYCGENELDLDIVAKQNET
jgi:hypothetical protein